MNGDTMDLHALHIFIKLGSLVWSKYTFIQIDSPTDRNRLKYNVLGSESIKINIFICNSNCVGGRKYVNGSDFLSIFFTKMKYVN